MNATPGLKGRDLLLDAMDRLRRIDPRTTQFDSDEVRDLESAVAQAVRQVFGEDSWEMGEYGVFRIAAGHMGLNDTRGDKQAKFSAGHSRAIERLEEIIEIVDRHLAQAPEVLELEPEEVPAPARAHRPAPARPSPRTPPSGPPAPAPKPSPSSPAPPPQGKTVPPPQEPAARRPPSGAALRPAQPGAILLLREGGEEVFLSATALLEKLAVDVTMPEGDQGAAETLSLASHTEITLAIMAVSSPPKGGLSGITSVMGKSRPRHETVFRLGLLVGRLGAGRVAILYGGEKPLEIPTDLFGVQYIQHKGEGGWQITLVRFLKAAGFMVDANMLFD